MGHESGRSFLLMTGAALLVASCNAAVGGGFVALVGGAGFLASQCYDRVRVRVREPHSGLLTCSPDVWVSDAGGSERRLRPCYSAALTEGKWMLTAREQGYAPAKTELVIPKHEGRCPNYTHTIELTLRREGEAPTMPLATRHAPSDVSSTPSGPSAASAGDLESPRARVVPPPIPGGSATPVVPTRSFELSTPPAPPPSVQPPAPTDAGSPR